MSNGSTVPRKYNTTGASKTLVGNWWEDSVWTESADRGNSATIDHIGAFSSGKPFDEGVTEDDSTSSVRRAGIGKRKQAMQEALWRQAMESEPPEQPKRERTPPAQPKLPAVGNVQGKKTFKQHFEHTDVFTDPDGKHRYEASNTMSRFSETARAVPRRTSPQSPYGSVSALASSAPITVYSDTVGGGGSIPGISKAAGANPFARASHFTQPIGEYKGGTTQIE